MKDKAIDSKQSRLSLESDWAYYRHVEQCHNELIYNTVQLTYAKEDEDGDDDDDDNTELQCRHHGQVIEPLSSRSSIYP